MKDSFGWKSFLLYAQSPKADKYVNVKTWKILLDEINLSYHLQNHKSRLICKCQDMKDYFGWNKSFLPFANHKSKLICKCQDMKDSFGWREIFPTKCKPQKQINM